MLLSTLQLRRYAARPGYLVDGLEYIWRDAVRSIPRLYAARRLATAGANPGFGGRTYQPPYNNNNDALLQWHDCDAFGPKEFNHLPARRKRKGKYYEQWSPTKALRDWLRKGQETSDVELDILTRAAASPSLRLPIVALQVDMVRAENSQPPGLFSKHLITEYALELKLQYLETQDITIEDIDLWLWILKAEYSGEMAHRVCLSNRPLPPFVIFQVLDHGQVFKGPEKLIPLYDYLPQAVLGGDLVSNLENSTSQISSSSELEATPAPRVGRLSKEDRWPPQLFVRLLNLMVHHSLLSWPASLPSIARFAERYIETITGPDRGGLIPDLAAHQRQNYVHNEALAIFGIPAPHQPLANSKYNWEAQKVILALSSKMSRPPLIDENGFRAIRSVLNCLRKSRSEQQAAARLSKTWPPYRQAWDGLDERRPLENDYSRNMKAGILAREAGYVPLSSDQALDILGGADLDKSPSIPFRTTAPSIRVRPTLTVQKDNRRMSLFWPWVASIRATRNAHEAWQAFLHPPTPDLLLCAAIYYEMFVKLYARGVDTDNTLPGTSLESHPFHDANLTEFEKARVRPPRPSELYEHMRARGIRPVGNCLMVLLRNATSLEQIARYLTDSLEDELVSSTFVTLVDRRNQLGRPFELDEIRPLLSMPLHLFRACAIGVSKTMPYAWVQEGLMRRSPDTHRLVNLINMTMARMEAEKIKSMLVWHVIFQILAHPGIAVLPQPKGLPPASFEAENRIHALRIFMRVYHHVHATVGTVDMKMFDKLCLILRRAVTAVGFKKGNSKYFDEVVDDAHAALKAAAAKLTQRIELPKHPNVKLLQLPMFGYRFGPVQVHSYFRTLAYLGDHDELLKRMEWIISEGLGADGRAGLIDTVKDPDHPDMERLYASIVMFRAYMTDQVPSETMEALKARMMKISEEKGLAWSWPEDEDVEHFMEMERYRGDEAAFWDVHRQR